MQSEIFVGNLYILNLDVAMNCDQMGTENVPVCKLFTVNYDNIITMKSRTQRE